MRASTFGSHRATLSDGSHSRPRLIGVTTPCATGNPAAGAWSMKSASSPTMHPRIVHGLPLKSAPNHASCARYHDSTSSHVPGAGSRTTARGFDRGGSSCNRPLIVSLGRFTAPSSRRV